MKSDIMEEEKKTPFIDENNAAEAATVKKKHPMGKARFALYYLLFCAVVFMFWQLLGSVCVEYSKYGYELGHNEAYLLWSWLILIVWIIGSVAFAITAEKAEA